MQQAWAETLLIKERGKNELQLASQDILVTSMDVLSQVILNIMLFVGVKAQNDSKRLWQANIIVSRKQIVQVKLATISTSYLA